MTASMEAAARFISSVLLNALWQDAVIAAAVAATLRIVRGVNATTRYAAWCAALVAGVAVPIAIAASIQAPAAHSFSSRARPRIESVLTVAPMQTHVGSGPPATRAVHTFSRATLTLSAGAAAAAAIAWATGALAILVRLGIGLAQLERLKADALPLPVRYRLRLERWRRALKGSRDVRLCVSHAVTVPVAVGIFDAMILLPQRLIERLKESEIDQIVLHELAHLRRGDDWVNGLQRLAQAVLFFSPGLAYIGRQMDLEREVACDDWVLHQTAEVVPYATCLARMAEITAWPHRALAAPGAFLTRRSVSIRIERLLQSHRDARLRVSLFPAAFSAAAVLALAIVGAYVSPSIAFPAPVFKVPHHAARPAARRKIAMARTTTRVAAAARAMPAFRTTPAPVKTRYLIKYVAIAHTPSPAPRKTAAAPAPAPSDFIGEMESAGYRGLSVDELVELRLTGVSARYIRDLQNAGLSHPSVGKLEELHTMGITGAYIRNLASAGYANLSPSQLIDLSVAGVDAAFVRNAKARGFKNLSVDQLVELKYTGVL